MITNFDRYRGYPYWNDPFITQEPHLFLKIEKIIIFLRFRYSSINIFFAVVIYNMFKKSKTDDLE